MRTFCVLALALQLYLVSVSCGAPAQLDGREPAEELITRAGRSLSAVKTYKDATSLLRFKLGLDNASKQVLKTWTTNKRNPCKAPLWLGVTCKTIDGQARVIKLDLSNRNLVGKVPSGWAVPAKLGSLLLHNNRLSGNVFDGWVMPSTLKVINLSNNKLSGSIPSSVKLPAGLTDLLLSTNAIKGSITAALKLPRVLLRLDLSSNQLSGNWPEDISLPKGLKLLDIHSNQFDGELPQTWELPRTLETLDISDCAFIGSIPSDLTLSKLKVANLYGNDFTGELPIWTCPASAKIWVLPQTGDGPCGDVPEGPKFWSYDMDEEITAGYLPSCDDITGGPPLAPFVLAPCPDADEGQTCTPGSSTLTGSTAGCCACRATKASTAAYYVDYDDDDNAVPVCDKDLIPEDVTIPTIAASTVVYYPGNSLKGFDGGDWGCATGDYSEIMVKVNDEYEGWIYQSFFVKSSSLGPCDTPTSCGGKVELGASCSGAGQCCTSPEGGGHAQATCFYPFIGSNGKCGVPPTADLKVACEADDSGTPQSGWLCTSSPLSLSEDEGALGICTDCEGTDDDSCQCLGCSDRPCPEGYECVEGNEMDVCRKA